MRLVGMIRRALRQERRRGLEGSWSYDLARHDSLVWAYRAEAAKLAGEREHTGEP